MSISFIYGCMLEALSSIPNAGCGEMENIKGDKWRKHFVFKIKINNERFNA